MKAYNEDFKLRVVQLYNVGKSVQELCTEFNLKSQTVYAWIKKYNTTDKEVRDAKPMLSDLEIENIRLKKVIERKDMELDILKQAALIMAQKN